MSPAEQPTLALDDFRAWAIAESARIVDEAVRSGGDPWASSLCLLSDAAGLAAHRRCRTTSLIGVVGGLSCWAAALGALLWTVRGLPTFFGAPAALVLFIGGFAFLFGTTAARAGIVRLHALAVDLALAAAGGHALFNVSIENAATFNQPKLAGDDMALAAVDPAGQWVRMEGLVCRYFIRPADVLSCTPAAHGSSRGLRVAYRVGTAVVDIVIYSERAAQTFRNATVGGHSTPHRRLADVLNSVR